MFVNVWQSRLYFHNYDYWLVACSTFLTLIRILSFRILFLLLAVSYYLYDALWLKDITVALPSRS